jgi:hypothetical protein
MGIHPERDRRVSMPEPVGHDVHRDTRDKEQGRVHVPQVVQPSMCNGNSGASVVCHLMFDVRCLPIVDTSPVRLTATAHSAHADDRSSLLQSSAAHDRAGGSREKTGH